MSEVGCYVLHLYCDSGREDCPNRHEDVAEFTGCNRGQAVREARGRGWSVGKIALCPWCRALPRIKRATEQEEEE